MEADDYTPFPQMPAMSWLHWHAACAFGMAGIEEQLIGNVLHPGTTQTWEDANSFYGNIHTEARHPTALAFSDEMHAWQRAFFIELMERETGFDIAPFDPGPFIAMAREQDAAFDFSSAVDRVRDAVYAMPHMGPFRAVPWTAQQIGRGISSYASWLFHDGKTVRLYGKPLMDKDGRIIEGVDPAAFRMVGQFFAVDQRQGYAFVQHKQFPYVDHIVPLQGVDLQSFVALNHSFARDNSAVFHRSGKRLTKDVRGFEILPAPDGSPERSEKAQDSKHTYAGDKVLEGRSWMAPVDAVCCPVRTITIDERIVLPPAYRLFASMERDPDGLPPAGLRPMLRDLREHFGQLFRVGRVMIKAGRFPRVKLTPAHWQKLEEAARGSGAHETFRAEFYDRLDHDGLAGETPSGNLNAGVMRITLDLAFPALFDWAQVDAVLWPHLEALPVLYAVQGYGIATEMRHWANRDPALHALAVREHAVCGLGLSGADMDGFSDRPEHRSFASTLPAGYRPVPDLGFKTLVAADVLRETTLARLAKVPLAQLSTVAGGATLIQLGEVPIWGVESDEAALIAAYRQARSALCEHALSQEMLVGGAYGDLVPAIAARYLEDWR
ncbi:hypothetical protein [Pseudaminobacter sp. NGMCC 1.201702]|uniref:hypothetical protein n=1 Tax=Pseudaminobacter sp. NGMCC 1.201702 TaxID=3391825 RepID=UPI0039EF1650